MTITQFDPLSFIASQPEASQNYLLLIRQYILEVVPEATELLNYGTLAFSLIEGGKRDQQVMVAGFKKYIGFYPHPETIEQFKGSLVGYKQGKGSLQFPLNEPLPKTLIQEMVLFRKNMLLKTDK
ncbi:MAG: DUF1801 domain-containing protein [Clostridia bacterium]|nr:DUF1801 domain-containing protein [Clostridia bacterium]